MPGGDGDLIPAIHPIGQIPLVTTEAPRSLVNPGDIARSGAEMGRGLKEAGAGLMDLATPVAEAQAASDLQNQKVTIGPDGKIQVINPARSFAFGQAGDAAARVIQQGTTSQVGATVDTALTDIHMKHLGDPKGQATANDAFVAGLKGVTGNPLIDAVVQNRARVTGAQHLDSNIEHTAGIAVANSERSLSAQREDVEQQLETLAQSGVGAGDPNYDKLMDQRKAVQEQFAANPLLKEPPEVVAIRDKEFGTRMQGYHLISGLDSIVKTKNIFEAQKALDEFVKEQPNLSRQDAMRLRADGMAHLEKFRPQAEADITSSHERASALLKGFAGGTDKGPDAAQFKNSALGALMNARKVGDFWGARQLEGAMNYAGISFPALKDDGSGSTIKGNAPASTSPNAVTVPPLPPAAPPAPDLGAVTKQLNLTPQEQHLYQHHLDNLTGPGGITNANGSRETVKQTTIEVEGKTYNIPTVWDGKELSAKDALARAKAEGLEKFPSYKDEATAEARYGQMHKFMDKDVQSTNAGHAPDGTPASQAAFTPGAPVTAIPGRPGQYSQSSMEQLARNAGFDEAGAKTIAAIAMGESGGFASAKNEKNKDGSIDYGLTQINTVHGAQYAQAAIDPQEAFKKAFEVSKGGKDFSPWVQYQNGGYKRFLGTSGVSSANGNAPHSAAELAANPYLNSAVIRSMMEDKGDRKSSISAIADMTENLAKVGIQSPPEQVGAVLQFAQNNPTDESAQNIAAKVMGTQLALAAVSGGSMGAGGGGGGGAVSASGGTSNREAAEQEIRAWASGPDILHKQAAAVAMEREIEFDKFAKEHPYLHAANAGIIKGGAPMIDPGQPQNIPGAIAARAGMADFIGKMRGTQAPSLLGEAGDGDALKAAFTGPTGIDVARGITQLKPEVLSSLSNEKDFREGVIGMTRSIDPAKQDAAFGLMERAYGLGSAEFMAQWGKDQVDRMSTWKGRDSMLDPAQRAKENQDKLDPAARLGYEKLKPVGEELARKITPDQVSNKVQNQGGWSDLFSLSGGQMTFGNKDPAPGAPGESAPKTAMYGQYADAFVHNFAQNGDATLADQAGIASVQSNWKPSPLNNGSVMRYAPEDVYRNKDGSPMTVNGSTDWLREQYDAEVKKLVGYTGDTQPGHSRNLSEIGATHEQDQAFEKFTSPRTLISDGTTEDDVRSGKGASYLVAVTVNGRTEMLTQPDGKWARIYFTAPAAPNLQPTPPGPWRSPIPPGLML